MLWLLILTALGGTALVYKSSKNGESSAPSDPILGSGGAALVLDPGISADEQQAITTAIQHETTMKNLYDFGQAMLPDFPIAASTLIAKSGYIVRPAKPVKRYVAPSSGETIKGGAVRMTNNVITKTAPNIAAGLTFRGISSRMAGETASREGMARTGPHDKPPVFGFDPKPKIPAKLVNSGKAVTRAWYIDAPDSLSPPESLSMDFTADLNSAVVGADWDPTGLTDVVEDAANAVGSVAKGGFNIVTHPERSVSDVWTAITHPADSIEAFAGGLVDALHLIPGMDEAGELLKKFAKTGFGEWCLRIMATYGYYVTAPYLGSALAAISFSLPGVAKADPFMDAWMKETIDRVMKTVQVLLLNQANLQNIGSATSEALNKFLADNPAVQELVNKLMAQTTSGVDLLKSKLGDEITKQITEGAKDAVSNAVSKLAEEYGYPPDFSKIAKDAGISEVSAAAAYDLIAKTNYQGTIAWDAKTGQDIIAKLQKAKLSNVANASKTISTGVYADPRMTKKGFAVTSNRGAKAAERKKWVTLYLSRA